MTNALERMCNAIPCDSVGIDRGEYVARHRTGTQPINSADPWLAEKVKAAYPSAIILGIGVYHSSVEKPKATSEHSHWFVRFTV